MTRAWDTAGRWKVTHSAQMERCCSLKQAGMRLRAATHRA